MAIRLKALSGTYAIARLDAADRIPDWADCGGFVSISRTEDELSIVCLQEHIPNGVRNDENWSCFKFEGPFAFDETGVVLSVIAPLSTNGIGIFVVSTFDGDHILIKADDVLRSLDLLEQAGHSFV
ncbi:ACT domain-containing protein [Mesorhizobium sp. LHD-90]|uniref:ACT domain-containing protein n=1 Tax=Mesorhizobium sp. LHD-90 TaxID=3071414 RepID=UPI0027E05470|nr:ACT domain-containing protein [Mesorhizobium sp. LHD-90]MDQ6432667.1 ACT domain-containing protein [Mesorhizobium sp. LHD-90]